MAQATTEAPPARAAVKRSPPTPKALQAGSPKPPAPGKTSRLPGALAAELVAAEARYQRTKRAHEKAKTKRREMIDQVIPKVVLGEWVKVRDWLIRITMQPSGDSFSLSEYLKHHPLTPEMAPYVTESTDSPRLWIKPG